ncbi:hypothetical protein [Paenibacillus sp. 1P03SA]|uniref:hypothetical protein n=1 Tax=Paenibacillus sp. 1P03SA TaxID=3132294 RepID=UPI0039A125D0
MTIGIRFNEDSGRKSKRRDCWLPFLGIRAYGGIGGKPAGPGPECEIKIKTINGITFT